MRLVNPLSITGIGDPFILKPGDARFAGTYYLYATSFKTGFKVWSSRDLARWEDRGLCFEPDADAWSLDCYWAPECVELDGRYYLFYSANTKLNPNGEDETFRIGVAVSDSPLGPFRDVARQPLFDPGFPVIDANVLIDDDGRMYLTCSRCCYKHKVGDYEESWIYGAELSPDMRSIKGELQLLLRPEQAWEDRSAKTTGRRWNEGSFLMKRNGLYYMFFSANHYQDKHYAVGYATSRTPLGPYQKYEGNPILSHDYPRMSGPGHNSITEAPDGEPLIVYHTHADPLKGGGNRQVCISPLRFRADGSIENVVY